MRWRLFHRTSYRYDRPVFLEPHLLRLTPRGDAAQRLLSQTVTVRPEPAGRALLTDVDGNAVLSVWFDGLVDGLHIEVAAEAETLRDNPFDYLLDASRARLPVPLLPAEAVLAGPCLAPLESPRAAALAAELLAQGATTPRDFLWALTAWMGRHLRPLTRRRSGIWSPDAVLERGAGACRDLAVCALAACRSVGLPCRFVSGYQAGEGQTEEPELHAWIEAWVPGGGWRGFDPSLGLAVADRHLALAAAADAADAAPVVGAFRGTGAVARLTHAVRLDVA